MSERGTYENRKRGKQLLRFDGMNYLQNITPTDIDALIDVRDKVLVLFEAKLADKECPFGQKLALERLIRDAYKAGKHAICIIGEHNITDPDCDVFLKDLIAREVYDTEYKAWKPMKKTMTVKELADWYISRFYTEGDL